MTVYLLLFRGVGGATQLPVAPLRDELTAAGFENVGTYINSGNAYVRSDLSRDEVVDIVARICREHFDFTKDIHAPTLEQWQQVIAENPFPEFAEGRHLHVAWLGGEPDPDAVTGLRELCVDGEGIEVRSVDGGTVAYLHTPHGFGRSKLAERWDNQIGVPNTARNWNTVLKLAELGEAAAAT